MPLLRFWVYRTYEVHTDLFKRLAHNGHTSEGSWAMPALVGSLLTCFTRTTILSGFLGKSWPEKVGLYPVEGLLISHMASKGSVMGPSQNFLSMLFWYY